MLLLAIDWGFLDQPFGYEKVSNYLWFAGIVLATLLLKRLIANIISNAGGKLTNRLDPAHKHALRDLIRKPLEWLLVTMLFYVAINQLAELMDHIVLLHRGKGTGHMGDLTLGDVADHVFLFFIILFFTLTLLRVIDYIYETQHTKARAQQNKERQQLLPLLKDVTKLLAGTLSAFWVLGSVFHVNIPALITGLGIGGVAIALAAKESVENLFAAFTILSDKSFQVGDSLKLGELEGVVESIGFRSTRLRSGDGAAYIVPNQKLVNENLINLSNRNTRLVQLSINVNYSITQTSLEQIIAELKQMAGNTVPVQQPVEVTVEKFGTLTFQLTLSYLLPFPMEESRNEDVVKREINLGAYGIVSKHNALPTTIATTNGQ